MTGPAFHTARKALGFKTQLSLADHLHLSERTINTWEREGPSRLAALWIEAELRADRRHRLLQELAATA